jgi:hypothetical protein
MRIERGDRLSKVPRYETVRRYTDEHALTVSLTTTEKFHFSILLSKHGLAFTGPAYSTKHARHVNSPAINSPVVPVFDKSKDRVLSNCLQSGTTVNVHGLST